MGQHARGSKGGWSNRTFYVDEGNGYWSDHSQKAGE